MRKKKSCQDNDSFQNEYSFFDDFLSSLGFDFTEDLGPDNHHISEDVENEELLGGIPDNLENYLNREDKLLNLQKEKYLQQIKKYTLPDMEQKLFDSVPKKEDTFSSVVSDISRRLTRPLLRKMASATDEYADAICSLAFSKDMNLAIIWDDIPDYDLKTLEYKFYKFLDADRILGIRVEEDGYEPFTVYGLKNHAHSVGSKNCKFRTYSTLCCDLADFLSVIIIHQQVSNYIYQLLKEGTQDVLYGAFYSRLFDYTYRFTSLHYQEVYPCNRRKEFDENLSLKWELPKFVNAYHSPWLKWMAENGLITLLPHVPYSKIDSILGENEACCILSDEDARRLPYMYLMSHPVPFNEFVYRDRSGRIWGLPSCVGRKGCYTDSDYCELYRDLFTLIAEEKNGAKRIVDYYKELNSSYAKSFMLKKNIPQKVLSFMKKSGFNRYFGFVEFDEDTDLTKVEEISNEFSALWETYLQPIDSTENVIRFRKLGQHKAAGLYYPSFGCLCVDVRHPSSLVHEYGHLIDFTYGCLSTMSDFYELRSLYKGALLSYMEGENGEAFRNKMRRKSKYNLSYYLTPTEIFARCFELYVSKILGVNNSIVPDTFDEGIYPQEEAFISKVKGYFDALLKKKLNTLQTLQCDVAAEIK